MTVLGFFMETSFRVPPPPPFRRKMLLRLWLKVGRQRRIFHCHFRKRTAVSRFDVNAPSQPVVACLRGNRAANRGKQPKVERQRRGLLLEAGGTVMMSLLDTLSRGEWFVAEDGTLHPERKTKAATPNISRSLLGTLWDWASFPQELVVNTPYESSGWVGEMDFANKEYEIEF